MKRNGTILFFIALILSWTVTGQIDRRLERQTPAAKTEKRIALVIGNAAYTKAKPLANPSNDAADMAKTLKELGFEVISGINQNKRQMETSIREFGTKLATSGGVGLFYYAGHGIQVAGENYLVPVDADIPEEDEVSYSAVPISLVLGKMATAKNDLNIVILDACRNNPFARSWRSYRDSSNTDGLAKISPPTGTLVLYATEPGKVASDGTGRNGLFTEALLRQIKQPNLEYDQLVKAVSADVWQKSNKQQLPWKEGNSLQDFYFVAKADMTTNTIGTQTNNDKTSNLDAINDAKQATSNINSSTETSIITGSRVFYDGFYKAFIDENTVVWWLRFYENRTVICTKTANMTEFDLAKWFYKDSERRGIAIGKFEISGSKIKFSCISPNNTVNYTGTIEGNTLKLDVHSLADDFQTSLTYIFRKSTLDSK